MIALDAVSFAYGNRPMFKALSISLTRPVEVIIGPSGCGKSTLLKLLAGILVPSAGRVLPERSKTLLVLQDDALFPWLTGIENIGLMFPDITNIPQWIAEQPGYVLIRDFIGDKVWKMSFGQRRSVELFRAIAAPVDILCLDEPFNFLDAARRQAFLEILMAQASTRQVILTTHELADLPEELRYGHVFEHPLPLSELKAKRF